MTIHGALRDLVAEIVRDELARAKPAAPEHVTVTEYAARYAIAESTVRHAVATGRLPATRIGRAIRIPATAMIGAPTRPAKPDATARARMKLLGGGSVR